MNNDELFLSELEGRVLTKDEIARAHRIRKEWMAAYHSLLMQEQGMGNLPLIEHCEKVITIIDSMLSVQPTFH